MTTTIMIGDRNNGPTRDLTSLSFDEELSFNFSSSSGELRNSARMRSSSIKTSADGIDSVEGG